jgi:S-adenosylmethionine-diacylglycerol 3-amino-3-carboxypropyl transferase
MTMLGVPESQHALFAGDGADGGFIQKSLRHVFTQLPLKENYFWQLYFHGRYQTECAPNYLQPNQFHALRRETQKLHTYTDTLTGFLQKKPGQYSHFVLLDHQDWLAANDRHALSEEWEHILDNSRQGTKILLRSAAYEVDFLPSFVTERVTFDREKAAQWHPRDRVGTYGSVYIGTVN